jgi:TrmH family RNA methyltransferase
VTGDHTALAVTSGREQALAALWAVQERVEEQVCTGLSEVERTTLTSLLRRVQQAARGCGPACKPSRLA